LLKILCKVLEVSNFLSFSGSNWEFWYKFFLLVYLLTLWDLFSCKSWIFEFAYFGEFLEVLVKKMPFPATSGEFSNPTLINFLSLVLALILWSEVMLLLNSYFGAEPEVKFLGLENLCLALLSKIRALLDKSGL
jgi:hypothetical protein